MHNIYHSLLLAAVVAETTDCAQYQSLLLAAVMARDDGMSTVSVTAVSCCCGPRRRTVHSMSLLLDAAVAETTDCPQYQSVLLAAVVA